jgi:hypothetical protein
MELMLVAPRAILLPLHALRVQPLVLHREVIAVLALAAGQNDLLACHDLLSPLLPPIFPPSLDANG